MQHSVALGSNAASEAATARARAEAAHRREIQRKDAEDRVRHSMLSMLSRICMT